MDDISKFILQLEAIHFINRMNAYELCTNVRTVGELADKVLNLLCVPWEVYPDMIEFEALAKKLKSDRTLMMTQVIKDDDGTYRIWCDLFPKTDSD